MSEGDQEYGLVMPFVVVQSKGGPYDDGAYTAGWEAGAIDRLLEIVSPEECSTYVRSANVRQIDLIAMRRGYAMTQSVVEHNPEEWTHVRLVKAVVEMDSLGEES